MKYQRSIILTLYGQNVIPFTQRTSPYRTVNYISVTKTKQLIPYPAKVADTYQTYTRTMCGRNVEFFSETWWYINNGRLKEEGNARTM